MRFKNHIDKTYNYYDNANRDFYDVLASDERKAELRAKIIAGDKKKIKLMSDSVKEFTSTGKLTNLSDSSEESK